MHAQTHRNNHDFQIAFFLAGKCHTPDGAYALLCDLRDKQVAAIAHYHVTRKRTQAKEIRAKEALYAGDSAANLEAAADLEEIGVRYADGLVLYAAAVDELAFIDKCIAALKQHRKYADLPDPEAHEAMQQEEWKLELLYRAENFLICHGTIPADEFGIMRAHPEFQTVILPAIEQLKLAVSQPETRALLLSCRPPVDFQKLLPPPPAPGDGVTNVLPQSR